MFLHYSHFFILAITVVLASSCSDEGSKKPPKKGSEDLTDRSKHEPPYSGSGGYGSNTITATATSSSGTVSGTTLKVQTGSVVTFNFSITGGNVNAVEMGSSGLSKPSWATTSSTSITLSPKTTDTVSGSVNVTGVDKDGEQISQSFTLSATNPYVSGYNNGSGYFPGQVADAGGKKQGSGVFGQILGSILPGMLGGGGGGGILGGLLGGGSGGGLGGILGGSTGGNSSGTNTINSKGSTTN